MQLRDIKICAHRSLKRIKEFPVVCCFLSGLLLKFCFCKGRCLPILLIPSFAVLLYFVHVSTKWSRAFLYGYAFGFGYFFSTLYWVAESFKCVGLGNFGYIAVFALVVYISIYPAFSCFTAKIFSKNKITLMIMFAIFWTLFEYVRGKLFTGFPWNLIGYAIYDIPYFSQIADIFGIYGVSFFTLIILLFSTTKKTFYYAVSIFVLIFSYGYYKVNFYNGFVEHDNKILITLIQPSISQEDKMDINKFKSNINRQVGLSLRDTTEQQKIIVWAEAAINIPVNCGTNVLQYITHLINDPNTTIITGCDRRDENGNLYNSAYVLNSQCEILQIYNKRHLLPFGEYIPNFLKSFGLGKVSQGVTNFSRGKSFRTISIKNIEQFDLVICYEIAFPGEVIDSNHSTWILNITNDAWFKNSDGPSQHLKISCFRAIEEGKSIARCANNGISCFIDCFGKTHNRLYTDTIGTTSHLMPMKSQTTIFSRYHNKTILLLLGISFLICFIAQFTKIGREERI